MARRATDPPARSRPTRFRTGSPPLSRNEILRAALHEAETGDLDQLTVRKLADQLDVTPMALYRHVRDKDDILEGVIDALLSKAGLPPSTLAWGEYLVALAESLRSVLREHPTIVSVFARRPQVGEAALARFSGALAVLTAAGWIHRGGHPAIAAVHTYALGFCALEAARNRHGADPVSSDASDATGLAAAVPGFVSEQQFRLGLRALVDGLGSPRRSPTRSGPGDDRPGRGSEGRAGAARGTSGARPWESCDGGRRARTVRSPRPRCHISMLVQPVRGRRRRRPHRPCGTRRARRRHEVARSRPLRRAAGSWTIDYEDHGGSRTRRVGGTHGARSTCAPRPEASSATASIAGCSPIAPLTPSRIDWIGVGSADTRHEQQWPLGVA